MPQMSPLGWAWVLIYVFMGYSFFLVLLFYFYKFNIYFLSFSSVLSGYFWMW